MSDELEQLREHVPHIRRIAARAGTLHGAWDVIFTAEEVLAGKSFWPYTTRQEAIQKCNEYFSELRRKHST